MESPIQNDVKKICLLLTSNNPDNATIALQLLKGEAALEEKVKEYFQPILAASNKKTIKAVPSIIRQLKMGKGTLKARLQIGTIPEIHDSIEKLFLNGQPLGHLPDWIRKLSNLKLLALSGCHLKELPDWIGELSHLTFLSIAKNQVQELPSSFGTLVNLKCCYLVENKIKTLPDSIKQLIHLQDFYVKEKNELSKDELNRIRECLPNARVH